MRTLRCGLIILGVTLAGLLALAGAALNPVLQTWAARRWLAGHPQWHVSVDRVAVELGRWRVRNLRLERGGAVLTVPSLEAEMPAVAAVLRGRYRIREL